MAQDVGKFGQKMAMTRLDKQKLMSRIVLTVQGNSQRVTPVLTGNLKRTETTRVESSGDRGVVGTNANYARFVHDGTRRMKARPFFTQGMAASRGTIDSLLEDAGVELFTKLT